MTLRALLVASAIAIGGPVLASGQESPRETFPATMEWRARVRGRATAPMPGPAG